VYQNEVPSKSSIHSKFEIVCLSNGHGESIDYLQLFIRDKSLGQSFDNQ